MRKVNPEYDVVYLKRFILSLISMNLIGIWNLKPARGIEWEEVLSNTPF